MQQDRRRFGFVTDEDDQCRGLVLLDDISAAVRRGDRDLAAVVRPDVPTVRAGQHLDELLAIAADSRLPIAVLGERKRLLGALTRRNTLAASGRQLVRGRRHGKYRQRPRQRTAGVPKTRKARRMTLPRRAPGDYSGAVRSKGVRRRAGAAVAMVLALVAVRGWAQAGDGAPGLEQLVREAMARDTVLQQRQLEVSNRQRGVAMEAAGKGFALALRLSDPEGEAGLVGVTVDEEGAEFGFGVAAGVTANLPHPFGSVSTTATVTGPADEDPDGETPAWELGPVAVKLSSGVEQPLGSLLGLDATGADDLEASHGVVQARRAVRARARALANAVLDRVAAIIEGEKAERRALFDLEELEAEVVRRREVFEENEDSHSFQSLLFEVERERRGLETTRLHLREERAALERDTGFARFGELAEVPVSMPLASDVEFSPDVIDATVGLRVSDLRIREDDNSQWPEVTFGADYDWNEVTLLGRCRLQPHRADCRRRPARLAAGAAGKWTHRRRTRRNRGAPRICRRADSGGARHPGSRIRHLGTA